MKKYVAPRIVCVDLRTEERVSICEYGSCGLPGPLVMVGNGGGS